MRGELFLAATAKIRSPRKYLVSAISALTLCASAVTIANAFTPGRESANRSHGPSSAIQIALWENGK